MIYRYTLHLLVFLLMVVAAPASAQVAFFGDVGLSLGAGSYLRSSEKKQFGGTLHGAAGLHYSIFELRAGLGGILFRDNNVPGSIAPAENRLLFDVPLGIAVRLPLRRKLLVIGADVSPFDAAGLLLLSPHIDLLVQRKHHNHGVFLKGLADLRHGDEAARPEYIGLGFKITFGG